MVSACCLNLPLRAWSRDLVAGVSTSVLFSLLLWPFDVYKPRGNPISILIPSTYTYININNFYPYTQRPHIPY